MKTICLSLGLFLLAQWGWAQKCRPSELPEGESSQPVYNQPIFSSEDASSFLLVIRKPVKLHKHEFHSEHVFVLEGKAKMVLDEDHMEIQKGDLIFIPRNTPHSVEPIGKKLKVISIQAPHFDGKDRILIEK